MVIAYSHTSDKRKRKFSLDGLIVFDRVIRIESRENLDWVEGGRYWKTNPDRQRISNSNFCHAIGVAVFDFSQQKNDAIEITVFNRLKRDCQFCQDKYESGFKRLRSCLT